VDAVKVLEGPLEAVSRVARPYPAWLLDGCETGLVLFAAAFLGHNDAIHFARAGLETTCVDVDAENLVAMQNVYPDEWGFVCGDAWTLAEWWRKHDKKWDAVSVDTWRGDAERRSLDTLDLWCSIANKVVTVTHTTGLDYTVPEGWNARLFERAHNVNWLVLTRA
jgi:hypothetical protein